MAIKVKLFPSTVDTKSYSRMTKIKVEQTLSRFTTNKEVVLTIDEFDGVHLGHKKLLDEIRKQAGQLDAVSAAIIVDQNPNESIFLQRPLSYLTSLPERVALLQAEGVDIVMVLTIDGKLANYDVHQFAGLLKKYFETKRLVVGPDFASSKESEGNPEYLTRLSREMGCLVTLVPPLMVDGKVVSSAAIRGSLEIGNMKQVSRFAGRYFRLSGCVVPGHQMARRLDFPTANLEIAPHQAMPPYGTYATLAHLEGITYQSVTAFGIRPRFANREHTMEVHILDFSKRIYDAELKIDFIERLREGIRFGWLGELTENLKEDVERGREVLGSLGTANRSISGSKNSS